MSVSNGHPYENVQNHDIHSAASTSEWDKMDVNELLNIFDAYPELKSDIIHVYSRRFGSSIVGMYAAHDDLPNDKRLRQSDADNEIHISGQRMWCDYLNVFGSVITRLKIDYSEFNETQCRELHELISQTCGGHLIEIKFIGIKREDPIDDLTKYQFPNVEMCEIRDSKLGDRLSLFSKLFPNVHILKVIDVNMDSFDAFFKHLDRFVIIKNINGVQNEINVICKD